MQSVLIGIQKQRKFTLWADLRSVSVAAVEQQQAAFDCRQGLGGSRLQGFLQGLSCAASPGPNRSLSQLTITPKVTN